MSLDWGWFKNLGVNGYSLVVILSMYNTYRYFLYKSSPCSQEKDPCYDKSVGPMYNKWLHIKPVSCGWNFGPQSWEARYMQWGRLDSSWIYNQKDIIDICISTTCHVHISWVHKTLDQNGWIIKLFSISTNFWSGVGCFAYYAL